MMYGRKTFSLYSWKVLQHLNANCTVQYENCRFGGILLNSPVCPYGILNHIWCLTWFFRSQIAKEESLDFHVKKNSSRSPSRLWHPMYSFENSWQSVFTHFLFWWRALRHRVPQRKFVSWNAVIYWLRSLRDPFFDERFVLIFPNSGPATNHRKRAFGFAVIPITPPSPLINSLFCSWAWSRVE